MLDIIRAVCNNYGYVYRRHEVNVDSVYGLNYSQNGWCIATKVGDCDIALYYLYSEIIYSIPGVLGH